MPAGRSSSTKLEVCARRPTDDERGRKTETGALQFHPKSDSRYRPRKPLLALQRTNRSHDPPAWTTDLRRRRPPKVTRQSYFGWLIRWGRRFRHVTNPRLNFFAPN